MKFKPLLLLVLVFGIQLASLNVNSQNKPRQAKTENKYPGTFMISKTEFDQLLSSKPGEKTALANKYLDGSTTMMNSLNGDMKFLKAKLGYFKNAILMIQVNGEYSTQIFIMSEDKSVFYKGKKEKDGVLMTKCSEDDIVSE
jgi:hypothetical protein